MKRIVVFWSFLMGACITVNAQYDTLQTSPYIYCYNWPMTGVGTSLPTVREYCCAVGNNWQKWRGHRLRELALYQHADSPIKIVGFAFTSANCYECTARLSLYDSTMGILFSDTTSGMTNYWPDWYTDTLVYQMFALPGISHSEWHHGNLGDDVIVLKEYYLPAKESIVVNGDFWIGISQPQRDGNPDAINSPYYVFEDFEPPYHITDVRFRVLENGVWLDDTMEGTIPELFVLIEPNCPNVTGLTGTMDSLGNVDISWDSTDNQTKWVVHFTGPGVMETDTVTSCHKHYSGLYPNQAYSVKVNARCYQSKYNIWSGWGETIWIGNTTGSIDEAAAFGFTLKPNPAMGKASVSSEGYDGAATVSVTTVDGIEVLRHDNTTLPLTLDLAGLASGIYLVRVSTATGTATKKLVVQ